MGRSNTIIAPPITGSGPNDWHVEEGIMRPGLDRETEQAVLARRRARAGLAPVMEDAPDKAELREKAKALTMAERELAKERAALERERAEFEAQKAAQQEARAKARGGA